MWLILHFFHNIGINKSTSLQNIASVCIVCDCVPIFLSRKFLKNGSTHIKFICLSVSISSIFVIAHSGNDGYLTFQKCQYNIAEHQLRLCKASTCFSFKNKIYTQLCCNMKMCSSTFSPGANGCLRTKWPRNLPHVLIGDHLVTY